MRKMLFICTPFLKGVDPGGLILLRTWAGLYIQIWEQIWKELIICIIEDDLGD